MNTKVEKIIKAEKPEMIDLRFIDILGVWQHASAPISELETILKDGMGFDGSSIKGFQNIYDSDLLLEVDQNTAHIDPFMETKTLVMIANIQDPEKQRRYEKDPRFIAAKAEDLLRKSKLADTSYWGPEAEFFLFSHLSYKTDPYNSGFKIDSKEAWWNSSQDGEEVNLGYKVAAKGGYFPVPPTDSMNDIRSEMVKVMESLGIGIEMHHHEVASAGQCEIDIKYDSLISMADKLMLYKYLVRGVAFKHGLTAIFMPKPIYGDNGSGMHVHSSLWKNRKNLFYKKGSYAELSQLALYYIGGILSHINSLLAFCAPTVNSYRRLVPHFEAPVKVAFAKRNRSAIIRIPMYHSGEKQAKTKRIEFRAPDPTANPYLAFSAILLAGIDGVKRKIDPTKAGFGPLDENIWELTGRQARLIKDVPGSLTESIKALKKDNNYLLKDGVFSSDLLDSFTSLKENEIEQIALRPTPYEFLFYSSL